MQFRTADERPWSFIRGNVDIERSLSAFIVFIPFIGGSKPYVCLSQTEIGKRSISCFRVGRYPCLSVCIRGSIFLNADRAPSSQLGRVGDRAR